MTKGERSKLTAEAFDLEREVADALVRMLETSSIDVQPSLAYRRYWAKQNKLVGIDF